jgi:hypothetical protein
MQTMVGHPVDDAKADQFRERMDRAQDAAHPAFSGARKRSAARSRISTRFRDKNPSALAEPAATTPVRNSAERRAPRTRSMTSWASKWMASTIPAT